MILTRLILSAIAIFVYFVSSANIAYGLGDPIGPWISTTVLPHTVASHASISTNDKIYLFGGANADDFNTVYSSTPNNGSVSSWNLVNTLPETKFRLATATKDNYVYVLGGTLYDGLEHYYDKVYLSKIQPDTSLSSWDEVTSLPEPRALGKAVVIGNRIYYAGGIDANLLPRDIVYGADINSDGTLGPWSIVGHLPYKMRGFGMVEYNNHIIVTGGDISVFPLLSKQTFKADINPDGTLTDFVETGTLLPRSPSSPQTIRIGEMLVSVGGGDFSGLIDKTYYAKINSDGTIEPWEVSASILPQGIAAGSIAYEDGYIYLMGGVGNDDGYTNKVYSSKFSLDQTLNVPLLKQTDPDWKNNTYDAANIWSPSDPTIGGWGCALTSAAMVFKYHGINKIPGNINLDPGTLNTWLKSQNDGYVRNGLVNWLSLTRLSKISKSINPTFVKDALEYSRYGSNKPQLTSDLTNNIPGILEEPGHFIVAKGISGNTFAINDPFYNRTQLTSYSNSFISLSRFVPSNTDLSYIMAVVDSPINITLKTASGSAVGESFIQQPLDHDGDTVGTSGASLKVLLYQKPDDGDFTINLSSTTNRNYQLDLYVYDKEGNVNLATINGFVGGGNSDDVGVDFDKDDSSLSSISQKVTFPQFIADLMQLVAAKEINLQFFTPSIVRANVAWGLSTKGPTKSAAIVQLRTIDSELLHWKNKGGITQNAYNILHNDIQALIASI